MTSKRMHTLTLVRAQKEICNCTDGDLTVFWVTQVTFYARKSCKTPLLGKAQP